MRIAPLPANELERLLALQQCNILDTSPERAFDDICQIAAYICQTPIALVSLIDEHRQWFKAKVGLEPTETHRDLAFCTHAILQNDIFIIPDALKDERFASNPLTLNAPFVRFYAGVPLVTAEGYKLGTLCVIDHVPRQLTPEQIYALKALSRQVVDQIETRRNLAEIERSATSSSMGRGIKPAKNSFVRRVAGWLGVTSALLIAVNGLVYYQFASLVQLPEIAENVQQPQNLEPLEAVAPGNRVVNTLVAGMVLEFILLTGVFYFICQATKKRQIIEQVLERERDFVTAVVDTTDALVVVLDLFGKIIRFNQKCVDITGYSFSEVRNKPFWGIFLDPDEAEFMKTAFSQIDASQLPKNHENNWVTRGGDRRLISWTNTVLLDAQGQTKYIISTGIDITEQKRAEAELRQTEEKYRSIFENSIVGIFQTTPDGRVLSANLALAKIYGYASPQEFISSLSNIAEQVYVDPAQRYALVERMQTQDQITDLESEVYRKDGSITWVSESVQAIRNDRGEVLYYEGTTVDISEAKRGEVERQRIQAQEILRNRQLAEQNEALDLARKRAEQAAQMKSTFLATLSHEIRTPLNAVLGMTGLLLDTPLNAQQHDFAETIRASGDNLLTLLNEILDFSKLEAGVMELEILDFDVVACTEEVVDLLAASAHAKRLEIATWVEPEVPALLRGDVSRLRQVLTNLISNAIKFTPTGEVVIRISLQSESASGAIATLLFSVEDTGIGIAPEALKKLFLPFSQVDASTTRKFGGTGLGLAICKQLVELMGGTIQVSSATEKGSKFQFDLTFEKQPQALAALDTSSLNGLRLLIVDDHAMSRKILRHQTASWGIQVDEAASSQIAWEMLTHSHSSAPYDVVILNVQMPNRDGELLRGAIAAHPLLAHVKLVMLTSLSPHNDMNRVRELGFSAYLVKPVKQSRLLDCLMQVNPAAARPPEPQIKSDRLMLPSVSTASVSNVSDRPLKKLRILLVEDSLVNQKVALNQLKNLGYKADVAANGKEALDLVSQIGYDLIFMDCQMPVMDGYAATQAIRQLQNGGLQDGGQGQPKRPVIIAMTANAMKEDQDRCIQVGMDDYLSKPVQKQVLADKLTHWSKAIATLNAEESAIAPCDDIL
ncbi:MAG: response regulator [Oscillatoriophycideae cyanobacterium NC_groundwater_1537_Pr4_S-0.65um_50_18]|nr:response regulator [Oscillatoriophycideae cyanobacterium NC_groundwater_1537_Pr4_S-0.65um_50_18]